MNSIFKRIRPFLNNPKTVLDVGCGIGGIDVPLFHGLDSPEIWLFDKNKKTDIIYGFDQGESFYTSFDSIRELMDSNRVTGYHLVEEYPERPFDLIISLLSWGYHYPIDTYIDQVCSSLENDGVLVIDIREKSGGLEKISERFDQIFIVHTGNKANQVIATGVKK